MDRCTECAYISERLGAAEGSGAAWRSRRVDGGAAGETGATKLNGDGIEELGDMMLMVVLMVLMAMMLLMASTDQRQAGITKRMRGRDCKGHAWNGVSTRRLQWESMERSAKELSSPPRRTPNGAFDTTLALALAVALARRSRSSLSLALCSSVPPPPSLLPRPSSPSPPPSPLPPHGPSPWQPPPPSPPPPPPDPPASGRD